MQDAENHRPKDEAVNSDATSKDTLEDLAADEKESDSKTTADADESPSPDGVSDGAEANKDPGPM